LATSYALIEQHMGTTNHRETPGMNTPLATANGMVIIAMTLDPHDAR
jgi:hypothetical protein